MAFFDDDPPTQQRRPSAPPPPPPGPPRGAPDAQQIMARRAVVGVALLVFVLLIAILMKGCVDGQKKTAVQNYSQKVDDLGTESTSKVTQALQALRNGNKQPLTQQSEIDRLAVDSDALTERARKLSTPGGLAPATQNLATALSLRADALTRIADRISTARGTSKSQAEDATSQIAGQMEVLLASDILWQTRVTPFIVDRYKDLELPSDALVASGTIKDLSWLDTGTLADRIDGQASADAIPNQPFVPGNHGHGISSVTANGKQLTAGGGATTVPAAGGLQFVVTIANGGEFDETNVPVTITGTDRVTKKQIFNETQKVQSSKKGTQSTVTIPITSTATKIFSVTVEVGAVPGETKKDNNKQTYSVLYSGAG